MPKPFSMAAAVVKILKMDWYVPISSARCRLNAETPSFCAANIQQAVNHTVNGLRRRSNSVPAVTEVRDPQLQQLRSFNPRTAITQHLLDGDDSFLFGPSTVATAANTTVKQIRSDLTGAGGAAPGAGTVHARCRSKRRRSVIAVVEECHDVG